MMLGHHGLGKSIIVNQGFLLTDILEGSSPNPFWQSVNLTKRLRAFVRLDEGDACSTCTLRGSYDRAFVTLKER